MNTLHNLTHGWYGLFTVYLLIAAASFAALKRSKAGAEQFVALPFTSLATMIIVGIGLALFQESLILLFKPPEFFMGFVSLLFIVAGGYLGGCYWATRGAPLRAVPGRGAVVSDAADSRREARQLDSDPESAASQTLHIAGVSVPLEDETKHFKFMGTTGSGKSTAMRELLNGALKRGDRAIIADPDGGYLSRFYDPSRGDVILNPFDTRSAKWNLFAYTAPS